MSDNISVHGLTSRVEVWRDRMGIAHIRAKSVEDAFFGQGYVHAKDRLWQMDYDRHRAYGRWAELAGPAGAAQDILIRRFSIEQSCRMDYDASDDKTKAMLDAYCLGVNHFISNCVELPIEYSLLGIEPSEWRPWDGLAVYKVRHVTMGVWEAKLWRAKIAKHVGASGLASLYPDSPQHHLLVLPPGARYVPQDVACIDDLYRALEAIEWLHDDGSGSNNWVISGENTASGKPLLAGDPHRAIEVPDVYYQNHVSCDVFDVSGLSFPGLPAFPHFGHNRSVAWCITHTGADTQDLFIETFSDSDPSLYLYRGQWLKADVRREVIRARGSDQVDIDVVTTHHGPVIAGDPARGRAIAMRYTAFLPGNQGWSSMLRMLSAKCCDEFEATQSEWVDPVNNLLYADVHGNFGYRMRGRVPVRNKLNAWLPVAGHTGEHEWQGYIGFAEMPASRNPAEGYIVTANNRVVGNDYPHYIALTFACDHRARRITELIAGRKALTTQHMARVHSDIYALAYEDLKAVLHTIEPRSVLGKRAKAILLVWDGQMSARCAAPTIFNAMRDDLLASVLSPLLGPHTHEAFCTASQGGPALVSRMRPNLFRLVSAGDRSLLPEGNSWASLMTESLERSCEALRLEMGDDPEKWHWGLLHRLAPLHPLSAVLPGAPRMLNPEPIPMSGDGDTVQHSGYRPATRFQVTTASVARYVFDLSDWDQSGWVVPHGVSGDPRSIHSTDQRGAWHEARLIPMLYSFERIEAEAALEVAFLPR